MTDDYGCKVCGKHFEEEEDLKSHGKDDHPEVNEAYPEIFDKKEEQPAEEIDQQEDKPVQSHDEWQKELQGLQDEFSEEGGAGSGPSKGGTALLPEQSAMKNINPDYDPFKATPKSQLMQTDPYITRTTEEAPEPSDSASSTPNYEGDWKDKLVWDGEHYVKAKEQEEEIVSDTVADNTGKDDEERGDDSPDHAVEEGGADDPLKKVSDLSENYKYMSRNKRVSLFESLKFTQGDSAILSGLEWNELTRPVKVEASEAYVKEQQEPEPKEYEGVDEDEEEDKAYEALYNVEKYHASADYKKKAIACNRCNEAFYNTTDRDIHYNEVHATEQEYNLPEECPFCNITIPENQNLDYHMQEEHGAHVPSQFTQTSLLGAMADADFDSLESHKKKAGESYKTLEVGGISQTFDTYEEMMEAYKNFPEGTWQYTQESHAKERMVDVDDYGVHYNHWTDPPTEDNDYNYDPKEGYKAKEDAVGGTDTLDRMATPYDEQQDRFRNERDQQSPLDNVYSAKEEDVLVDDSGEELDWFKSFGDSYTDGNQTLVDTDTPEMFGLALKKEGMNWNEDKQQYDYESNANEADHEHDWEVTGDADGDITSVCKGAGCDAKLWSHPGQSPPEGDVYYGYLGEVANEFGDYEVKCDCDEDPDCPQCKGKGTNTWTSSIYGGDESYGDDLKKERDELAKFINMASVENPMNVYGDQKRLEELDAILDSLATEEDDSNIHDKRLPAIGGYDPELDEDDPEEEWDERKPEIGGYDPELDYDG